MISNSTFSGNHVERPGNPTGGGAIAIFPSCISEITGSTFVNNTAVGFSKGGAIISDGTITVTNSTFTANSAETHGGAIALESGRATLANVTAAGNVSGQGAGIYSGATLTLRNTIVANNTGSANCVNSGGTVTDSGGNLRWPLADTSCPGTAGDPKLSALANNGGSTQTMALQAGSAAIQLAAANCPSTDQRGFVRRLLGGKCDAGAYEFGGVLLYYFPSVFK